MTKWVNVYPLLLPLTLWDCSWQSVQTSLYTCLLDSAFVGDVTLCSFCHFFVKSWNSCKMNWVSPSETMHLGTPISVKNSFRIWLHSLSRDSVVFSQVKTGWSSQLLVNLYCVFFNAKMFKPSCYHPVYGVSTDCRVLFFWVLANFLQILHLWYVAFVRYCVPKLFLIQW